MALIVYHGPFIDGVAVPYGLGDIEVPHGVPTEVPDDLAARLLDQPSNWKAVAPKAPVKSPAEPVKEVTDEP